MRLDYQARIGGKPFEGGDLSDVSVVLGTRQAMPELEEGLKGVSAGEQRTINVVFPAGHPNSKLAGQSAELHLSIKAVEEQSLPAVDEEFFRAYGVEQGGLAEMRAEVRKSMERELAERDPRPRCARRCSMRSIAITRSTCHGRSSRSRCSSCRSRPRGAWESAMRASCRRASRSRSRRAAGWHWDC